jgi:transposase
MGPTRETQLVALNCGDQIGDEVGRSGKKRAIVATARKLAVLLHHLWVSGEVYEPLHNSNRMAVAAAA